MLRILIRKFRNSAKTLEIGAIKNKWTHKCLPILLNVNIDLIEMNMNLQVITSCAIVVIVYNISNLPFESYV